jgi:putative hemolysin
MDDLLDALVGDVSEHDQNEYGIIQRDEHSWLADGQFPYFELLNYFEVHDGEIKGDFATVAGLMLHLTGRIPAIAEKIEWEGYFLEVVDMDGMRIDKILITKK